MSTDSVIASWGIRLNSDQELSLVNISRRLNNHSPLEYIPDQLRRFPYIRLYETVLPIENLEPASFDFSQLLADQRVFESKWGQHEAAHNHLLLWAQPNAHLKLLHLALLTTMNKYRTGLWKKKYHLNQLDRREQASLQRWGSPYAENLLPYIVIGHPTTSLDLNALSEFDWPYSTFTVRRLFMAKKDSPGTLSILKEVRLKD